MARHRRQRGSSAATPVRNRHRIRPRPLRFEFLEDRRVLSVIEISSIEQLQQIGNEPEYALDAHYVLTQDIDASATATWNDGAGFKPIGASFAGVFDGQGYAISDLSINRPQESSVGLSQAWRGMAKYAA